MLEGSSKSEADLLPPMSGGRELSLVAAGATSTLPYLVNSRYVKITPRIAATKVTLNPIAKVETF